MTRYFYAVHSISETSAFGARYQTIEFNSVVGTAGNQNTTAQLHYLVFSHGGISPLAL